LFNFVAYITGNTKSGGENSWYPPTSVYENYVEGYNSTFDRKLKEFNDANKIRSHSPEGDRFWGVSSIAYNRDILSEPKYTI
jgi:hypothetical protein